MRPAPAYMADKAEHQIIVTQLTPQVSRVHCAWSVLYRRRSLTVHITGEVALPVTEAMAVASDIQTAIQEAICRYTREPGPGTGRGR